MKTHHTLLLPALGLAALVTCGTALAGEGDAPPAWGQARGFSLGLQLQVDGLSVHDKGNPVAPVVDDMGAGLALVGGYAFTPRFHTRLTLGSARHGTSVGDLDVMHSMGSLEAHYRFLPERQVCPYVFASLGGSDVRADQGANHLELSGGTAGIGGGLLCGLTPHVGIDLSLRLEAVNWTRAEWSQDQPGGGTLKYQDSIEESGAASRLDVGVLWQF
jgi:hypothetical protein